MSFESFQASTALCRLFFSIDSWDFNIFQLHTEPAQATGVLVGASIFSHYVVHNTGIISSSCAKIFFTAVKEKRHWVCTVEQFLS